MLGPLHLSEYFLAHTIYHNYLLSSILCKIKMVFRILVHRSQKCLDIGSKNSFKNIWIFSPYLVLWMFWGFVVIVWMRQSRRGTILMCYPFHILFTVQSHRWSHTHALACWRAHILRSRTTRNTSLSTRMLNI